MGLAMSVEHPVEGALLADIQATIRQQRHDLPWGQGGELLFVAGQQDPLALLLA